jgi:fused signal recognition particle receptor
MSLFSLFTRKKPPQPKASQPKASDQASKASPPPVISEATTDIKTSLAKTSRLFSAAKKLLGQDPALSPATLLALRKTLLRADVGSDVTDFVIKKLQKTHNSSQQAPAIDSLKTTLVNLLNHPAPQQDLAQKPHTIMLVGINGAGKTTTLAKLAHHYQQTGHSVLLAAADTFRAAAIEQLQHWGQQHQIDVIAQQRGADSAAVLYDALHAAKKRRTDILLADTAGRLHTKVNLMHELRKCIKVMQKIDPEAPHQLLLVIDGTSGQNGLKQAQTFHEAINLDGIIITKLDGSAKGGVALAIAHTLKLPIVAVTTGEHIADLKLFDATAFVDGLLQNLPEASATS